MNILDGFTKRKKYVKSGDNNVKLESQWTSAETVECSDGKTVENKIQDICNSLADSGIEIKEQWEYGLFSIDPWKNGDGYTKDGYNTCVDFTLEPNTEYTIQISEDDGQTMYVGNLDYAVSQYGFYQTFTTNNTGVVYIWLISGRRYNDYLNGTIKACIIKGSVPLYQGKNVGLIMNGWGMQVKDKTDYPYNRFLDIYTPFGKYFSFNTGAYNENYKDGSTWSGLTIGNPQYAGATEAGARLETSNGGVDLSFMDDPRGQNEEVLNFNMGMYNGVQGGRYLFSFNEPEGYPYDRLSVSNKAIPMHFTENGIKVKRNNTVERTENEANWKNVNLYELDEAVKALQAEVARLSTRIASLS